MSDKLLTVKEVSNLLGVHVNTVRTMAEDGRLHGVKTKGENGHWRFKRSDVESMMGSDKKNDIPSLLQSITYILDDIPSSLLGEGVYSNASLWEYVHRYYGIRSVFGSIAVHAEMNVYQDIINRKGFIWIGEGAVNIMEAINHSPDKSERTKAKFLANEMKYAFGVVKHETIFYETSYSIVPLLVITDRSDKVWVVDGTLQQFYPNLEKGLAVLPLEKAKELYIGLEIYDKKKFAEVYSDPHINDKYIRIAKELEKDFETD